MKNIISLIYFGIVCSLITTSISAQSTGDITFVGFNADGDDDFAILVMNDLPANTLIYFTDNEPNVAGDGVADTNEGTIKWDTGGSVINAGTIITFTDTDVASNPGFATSVGSISYVESGMNLAAGGDALYAVLGDPTTNNTTAWLAGIQNQSGQEGANFSATGLVSGETFLDFSGGSGNPDGGAYDRSNISGTQAALLQSINNASNWNTNTSDGEALLPFTTTSVTVNSVTVSIAGDAGWRLLSLPKSGGTITDISDDSPVQGITGGSNTGSSSNFYIYDNSGAWEEPTNATTAWGDGYGFAMYFYNNTTNGSSALPVTLDADGLEPISDVTVNLYGGAANRYTLVGNPFASNINTNSITVTGGSIQNNISFWNDAGSTYLAQDRTGPYIIAPWQGFFVETSDASASSITIPTTAKTTSATSGTFFSKVADIRGDINFALSSETTNDQAIRLSFRANATPDWDLDDASKLTPLLTAYATLGFATNDMVKSVESLPYRLEEEVTLPMQLDLVGVEGEFSLGWDGLETIPDEWELVLHDYEQGTSVNLRDSDEYTFEAEPEVASKRNPLTILTMPGKAISKTTQDNRFAITIQPNSVANELNSMAYSFNLEQNYPNPFNPSTTISYTIAKEGMVELTVFNTVGQQITKLVNTTQVPGDYNVTWNTSNAPSGIYFYRLEVADGSMTRRMTVIK
jgi:hypothetical protein